MPGLSDDLRSPLSESDWKKLEDFLDGPGGPNLDTCVGFITAVATAPTMIPPSGWLPTVLADRPLDSHDDPVLALVLRLYNEILNGLSDKSVYHPDAERVQQIEDWCAGYMMGVRLDGDWLGDVEAMTPVFPIAVLAGEQPLNDPDDEDRIEDEEAWLQRAREDLGALALDAHEALAPMRRLPPAQPTSFKRESPKVGRNDPCPCGSGKKYKKCCGR